jgi:1,2-diacylglycerol 3-alpha-glucosyltransferase
MPFHQSQPRVRLAIMHNNFGPYHLARLNTAARLGEKCGVEVLGLELAAKAFSHPWTVEPGSLKGEKITLFRQKAIEELGTLELVTGTWSILNRLNLQAIALSLNKETYPAMLTVLAWTRLHRRVALIMMDSKYDDFPRHPVKEWAKRRVYGCFDGAIVAGRASREYAEFLGVPPEKIHFGYDVIDNDYFCKEAEKARQGEARLRKDYHLPQNYFVCVSRLDEKKNISLLLESYARYAGEAGARAWGLVICGSGPLEVQLKGQARRLGIDGVHFAGFVQIEELPIYYGLARCLITPSSHSEQWGLVVNEAMAAGLPVLVSQACGCAPELVQEGVNGYLFNPFDVGAMARLMHTMSSGSLDLKAMGENSRRIIAEFSPETFGRNLLKALEMARG